MDEGAAVQRKKPLLIAEDLPSAQHCYDTLGRESVLPHTVDSYLHI